VKSIVFGDTVAEVQVSVFGKTGVVL